LIYFVWINPSTEVGIISRTIQKAELVSFTHHTSIDLSNNSLCKPCIFDSILDIGGKQSMQETMTLHETDSSIAMADGRVHKRDPPVAAVTMQLWVCAPRPDKNKVHCSMPVTPRS
jgi:hypothetical protein